MKSWKRYFFSEVPIWGVAFLAWRSPEHWWVLPLVWTTFGVGARTGWYLRDKP